MRRLGVIGMAVLLTGCFDYHRIDAAPENAGGKYVRVELSDAGTSNVVPAIGPYVLYVEGEVESADTQGMTLTLRAVSRRGEGIAKWNGEKLSLKSVDIRAIRERLLSRRKSTIAGTAFGALGVALVFVIAKATGLVSGGPNNPPIPGT